MIMQNINRALEKGLIPENLPVYKAINDNKMNNKYINVFNINPELEMQEAIRREGNKINFYKLNVKEGTKGIGFTNIILYDNKNKTLPIGMDLSTKMIIDTSKLYLKLVNKKSFKFVTFENEEDDFSDINIKDVDVLEYKILDS